MNKTARTLSLVAGFTLLFGAAAGGVVFHWGEFDEFDVFIEINATDGDAGLQGKIDGDPWRYARVRRPDGRTIFEFEPKRNLWRQGVTEIQWESAEPPFDEFSLEDFLDRYPEGEYAARALTKDWSRLASATELTHDLPAGPEITSPEDGDEVELDGENLTITWEEVTDDFRGGPLDSEIVIYMVVIEFEGEINGEEVLQVLTIDVMPDTFSAEIPADFLKPDREYKIEVGAREESGNQTFSEIEICTEEGE